LSATESRSRDLRRVRRSRSHRCWDHLIVAPLWVAYKANLGTLLRTCDAVGAYEHESIPDDLVATADECVEIPMVGGGASLNVAVAGSLVLYRLAGMA
jgi:tRNA G18 (ribose-2'-O)-methylase SpoU